MWRESKLEAKVFFIEIGADDIFDFLYYIVLCDMILLIFMILKFLIYFYMVKNISRKVI